jgi:hypothetical protein
MHFQIPNLTPATVPSRTRVSTDYLTPTYLIGNVPPGPRPPGNHLPRIQFCPHFRSGSSGRSRATATTTAHRSGVKKAVSATFPECLSAPFLPSSQHKNEHKIRHSQPLNVTTFSEKQAKCYRYYKSVTRFLINKHVTLVYFKVIFQSNLHEINLGVGSLPLM